MGMQVRSAPEVEVGEATHALAAELETTVADERAGQGLDLGVGKNRTPNRDGVKGHEGGLVRKRQAARQPPAQEAGKQTEFSSRRKRPGAAAEGPRPRLRVARQIRGRRIGFEGEPFPRV